MKRAGKGYAIENNIRNKNPQWMVVDPKQSLFNDDYYIDNGGSNAKWATLDSDTNVAGFAPGMDDIGHIILDNKKDVKFNRNLVTSAGANYWVSKKNANIRDPGKYWETAVQDINGDGIPEVLIRDGNKDIRYINGYYLGKSKKGVVQAYQNYIDEKAPPEKRQVMKARNEFAPGELSYNYFLQQHLAQDENNLDGKLIPSPYLAKAGYKARAPSASNLLLKYKTSRCYNAALDDAFGNDEETKKFIKKVFGVIMANANLYKKYVSNKAIEYFQNQHISEKEAKKKHSGQVVSPYTEHCLYLVKDLCEDEDDLFIQDIKQQISMIMQNTQAPLQKKPEVGKVPIRTKLSGRSPNINAILNTREGDPVKPIVRNGQRQPNRQQQQGPNNYADFLNGLVTYPNTRNRPTLNEYEYDLDQELVREKATGKIMHLKTLYQNLIRDGYFPPSNNPNDYQNPDAQPNVQMVNGIPVYSPPQ